MGERLHTRVQRAAQLGRIELRMRRAARQTGRATTTRWVAQTLDEGDAALLRTLIRKGVPTEQNNPVAELERRAAEVLGAPCVAFGTGRMALTAILEALDLPPESDVVIPGYTCVAVPNAVRAAGHRVTFADIELDTFGISLEALQRAVTPKTRAVVMQQLYGLVSRDCLAIRDWCKARALPLINDCAQAAGARMGDQGIGMLGDAAFFSMEQSKPFSSGQGGLAMTSNASLLAALKKVQEATPQPTRALTKGILETQYLNWLQYQSGPYQRVLAPLYELLRGHKRVHATTHDECEGLIPEDFRRALPQELACLGLLQLARLSALNDTRRETATYWDAWCQSHGLKPAHVCAGSTPMFLRYPVRVQKARKRDTAWAIQELGTELGLWFASCTHPSHAYEPVGCPMAQKAVEECVNLPTLRYQHNG